MNHSRKNNASIYIDIQNNPQFLRLIIDSIPYLPNWQLDENSLPSNSFWEEFPNKTPKYFAFNFIKRTFEWSMGDSSPLDQSKYIPIRNEAHLSHVLNFIYDYSVSSSPLPLKSPNIPS